MRNLFFLLFFALIGFLQSCDSTPKAPKRSQEFIDDSILAARYDPWFDTIFAALPSAETGGKIKCPGGCFDDLDLFNKENPLPVFEPAELKRDTVVTSYFRYRNKVQGPLEHGDPFFNWAYDPAQASDLHIHAQQIRELIGWKYFCVFILDSAKYVQPQLDTSAKSFTPGKMEGYAVMVDFETGKPVCAFKVKAESSSEVSYNTYFSEDPKLAVAFETGPRTGIEVDLRFNLMTEIQEKLYESITTVRNDPSRIIHDPIN
jgi:hypothetical protein